MIRTHTTPIVDNFQLGPWRVEPRAGFIGKEGENVRLEPKVMNVLAVLAGAQGAVVSRQALLDEVWPNQVVTDDVLTTAISTLRRHLGDDPRQSRFVETVPKRGYRLIEPVTRIDPPVVDRPARSASPSGEAVADHAISRGAVWAAGLLIVAAIALFLWRSTHEASTQPTETGSIAVLPFDVFGDNPRLEVFADGLAEELIHQLSADADLKITSRTSSFQFRSGGNLREIASTLGVRNILEGSVRGDGDDLRVTVQMIDAQRDIHRWSRVFDVKGGSMLAMQEEVSNEVVALISGSSEATMLQTRLRHPVPNEAYQLYLLGQSHMRAATVGAYERAAQNFSDALRIAPDYPIAMTQYAAVRMLLHQYRGDGLEEATEAARKALDRALSLDPKLAEARAVYGLVWTYNKQFEAAEASFQEALQLRPNMSFAWHNYAFMLWSQGRPRDSIDAAREAVSLNPISGPYFILGDSLAYLGRFDAANDVYEGCVRINPTNSSCLLGQSSVVRMLGDLDTAGRLADQAAELLPEEYISLLTTRLGLALYAGDFGRAEKLQAQIDESIANENYVLRTNLLLSQQRGDLDRFIDTLATRRTALQALGQSDAGIDLVEAHARYLINDCEGVLRLYDRLLSNGHEFMSSHWPVEFGHTHLVNLLYCRRQAGLASPVALVDEVRRALLEDGEVSDYPARQYLRAKLHQLDGEPGRARKLLNELEARGWPFLWLTDQDPVFQGDLNKAK
ncbi:MAG: winged helix-turn-helix domain-containing protein [Xanthomonadales bacterium]|nr:winged helix-turn-helix domain-containing protein [Xanthomonadales bacterium]